MNIQNWSMDTYTFPSDCIGMRGNNLCCCYTQGVWKGSLIMSVGLMEKLPTMDMPLQPAMLFTLTYFKVICSYIYVHLKIKWSAIKGAMCYVLTHLDVSIKDWYADQSNSSFYLKPKCLQHIVKTRIWLVPVFLKATANCAADVHNGSRFRPWILNTKKL